MDSIDSGNKQFVDLEVMKNLEECDVLNNKDLEEIFLNEEVDFFI